MQTVRGSVGRGSARGTSQASTRPLSLHAWRDSGAHVLQLQNPVPLDGCQSDGVQAMTRHRCESVVSAWTAGAPLHADFAEARPGACATLESVVKSWGSGEAGSAFGE